MRLGLDYEMYPGVHGAIQFEYVLILLGLLYTLCHYSKMVATAAGNKVSKNLKVQSCKMKDESSTP